MLHVSASAQNLRLETVARGLQNPWAVAFLPNGRFLVTERAGRLRVVELNGRLNKPVEGLPDVALGGQGGRLDVLLDTDFAINLTLYFCFSEPASIGNGNPQGATLAPDGTLWMHEYGLQGGDEINLPKPGVNYGWPVITYGENYGGGQIGAGLTAPAGLEQPLHYWTPSVAPSGMAFLTSECYGKAWQGNLFAGSLKFAYLNRIELTAPYSGKVQRESKLISDVGERIRDVRQGPDGLLHVLTDSHNGKLIRLQPVP